jgi:hypothetical protein
MKRLLTLIGSVAAVFAAQDAAQAAVTFTPFVSSSDIAAAEGGNRATIAFNYAGTIFVDLVYFGVDKSQRHRRDTIWTANSRI